MYMISAESELRVTVKLNEDRDFHDGEAVAAAREFASRQRLAGAFDLNGAGVAWRSYNVVTVTFPGIYVAPRDV